MKLGGYIKRRKPLPMRRKKPRRTTVRRDPKYLKWIKQFDCWGREMFPDHVCKAIPGRYWMEAMHTGERPGKHIKADDWTVLPSCPTLHDEYDQSTGRFKGWTPTVKRKLTAPIVARYQAAYLVGREGNGS